MIDVKPILWQYDVDYLDNENKAEGSRKTKGFVVEMCCMLI